MWSIIILKKICIVCIVFFIWNTFFYYSFMFKYLRWILYLRWTQYKCNKYEYDFIRFGTILSLKILTYVNKHMKLILICWLKVFFKINYVHSMGFLSKIGHPVHAVSIWSFRIVPKRIRVDVRKARVIK